MLNQPYMTNFNPYANRQEIIRVNGLDGAKAYQMMPNSNIALFDGNDDVFYIKSTDGGGFGSIRTFRFEEIKSNPEAKNDYITRKDMEEYVKQLIQSAKSESTADRDD